ncbi:hypothetical protein MTsN3n11_05470 [Qipengyuania sp. MTN3-11]
MGNRSAETLLNCEHLSLRRTNRAARRSLAGARPIRARRSIANIRSSWEIKNRTAANRGRSIRSSMNGFAGITHARTESRATIVSKGYDTAKVGIPRMSPGRLTEVSWREPSSIVIALAAHPSRSRCRQVDASRSERIISPRLNSVGGPASSARLRLSSGLTAPKFSSLAVAGPSYRAASLASIEFSNEPSPFAPDECRTVSPCSPLYPIC